MPRTYINETYDLAYPLYGDGRLPFPMSVIRYLSVCIKGTPTSYPVKIKHVVLSENLISIVVTRDTLVSGKVSSETVGYFSISAPKTVSKAVMETTGEVEAFGMVFIGKVPESAYGRYNGDWKLDPSCVHYMPDNVYAGYQKFYTNGTEHAIEEALTLSTVDTDYLTLNKTNFDGGFGTDSSWYDGSDTTKQEQYEMVDGVNSYSADELYGSSGTTLAFVSSDSSKIKLSLTTKNNALVLTVTGTKNFPNCYGDNDEAGE